MPELTIDALLCELLAQKKPQAYFALYLALIDAKCALSSRPGKSIAVL
jgi:hypothetical protein